LFIACCCLGVWCKYENLSSKLNTVKKKGGRERERETERGKRREERRKERELSIGSKCCMIAYPLPIMSSRDCG
jgi:hypothetical protein